MDKKNEISPPVFALGCMRSGTTLIGAFIGTAPNILKVGELGAFYFSNFTARHKYSKAPSDYKGRYLDLLRNQSVEFVKDLCSENNAQTFVEDTPWNARIIPDLEELFPDAIYVMNVRHYTGVIQSMRNSWELGYTWAGPTDKDRASIWAEFNDYIDLLPAERTIFFSYDDFCQNPEKAIQSLEKQLHDKGIKGPFDPSVFSVSHATKGKELTAAFKDVSGKVHFQSIDSLNRDQWLEDDELAVSEIIRPVCDKIYDIAKIKIEPIHRKPCSSSLKL